VDFSLEMQAIFASVAPAPNPNFCFRYSPAARRRKKQVASEFSVDTVFSNHLAAAESAGTLPMIGGYNPAKSDMVFFRELPGGWRPLARRYRRNKVRRHRQNDFRYGVGRWFLSHLFQNASRRFDHGGSIIEKLLRDVVFDAAILELLAPFFHGRWGGRFPRCSFNRRGHSSARAGPEKAESGGDSQAARVMIHPAGWEEASLDGKTLFAGFAGTHDVGCSFRTVSTRGGADVRCQRELCDQAHAAG
jgi:hypothetical protein